MRRSGLLLFALALTACRDAEVVATVYTTVGEARQAGAIARGWIPSLLPPGAHDIREAHDPDSNRRWGLFSFQPEDEQALRSMLRPDEATLNGVVCDAPARIEWWPILLRGALNAEQIAATGLRSYHAASGDLFVAVNWAQRRAYYWTPEPATP